MDDREKPLSADLSLLKIGSLTLTPTFDPDVTEYETTTANATNTLTATPEDEDATVTVTLNDEELTGTTCTWEDGENELVIEVVNGTESKTYTVTVTHPGEDPEQGGEE